MQKSGAAELRHEKRASVRATRTFGNPQGMPKWRVRFYRSKNIPLSLSLYSIASQEHITTELHIKQMFS
jgi:hypothetical protein